MENWRIKTCYPRVWRFVFQKLLKRRNLSNRWTFVLISKGGNYLLPVDIDCKTLIPLFRPSLSLSLFDHSLYLMSFSVFAIFFTYYCFFFFIFCYISVYSFISLIFWRFSSRFISATMIVSDNWIFVTLSEKLEIFEWDYQSVFVTKMDNLILMFISLFEICSNTVGVC